MAEQDFIDNAEAVDQYLEYSRIVGDDDGGQLFSAEEYAEYKKKVLPMRLKNRLFTSWTNSAGMDCKLVGPETPCFCNHRYKQHKTDFKTVPAARPVLLPCKVSGCKCTTYHYVPLVSGRAIRCSCKHVTEDHSVEPPYQCQKSICQKCAGFRSSYTCGCGSPYSEHTMIVETKDEREARGHPTGGHDVPYQAMGGLTGFSSLAEGYERLDPSGRGAPSDEFLGQEITSSDHTFLRANVPTIQAQRRANKDYGAIEEDLAERISSMKKSGEDDMAYFERRYQEKDMRVKSGRRPIEFHLEIRPRTGTRNPTRKPKSAKWPLVDQ